MDKSRILIVGATGGLGKYIVRGSAREGHPTFILVRKSSVGSGPDPARKALLDEFESLGVVTLYADLDDHASLVAVLKQVDVVVSAVGAAALLDGQLKLIAAIREVGHIKSCIRFHACAVAAFVIAAVPAVGVRSDCDRHPAGEKPALDPMFAPKRAFQKAIREAGIPYTLVLNGAFASYMLAPLGQLDIIFSGDLKPPREKITILGSGEGKIVTTAEDDIGVLAVKAADDPRALNKKLVIRPKPNVMSFNSVMELWEKKIGHSLHKTFVPEAEVQRQIDGLSPPANFVQAIMLDITSGSEVYPLSPTHDVAADELAVKAADDPDYKYITVDEYLDNFV